ncbi:MAG: murein biosynthesis integral membrane protein MurJ [Duodenibacillus sp.]|nr:murein biosynthesis integral membrane protein MurJ [Duodenibacillus sp.]
MSLLRSAATVSGFTLLSRVTGLIRDMLIARFFGVTGATDAFYVAFRIPNLLRRLFAEGAFSSAFVPMLSQVKEQEGAERSDEFIGNVFTLLALAVLATSMLGVLFAPAVIWVIATGFAEHPETFDLAVALTRFMFPYIVFMSLVAFAAAVLNTWKHFAIPAFTPVLLNLSFIAFIVLVSHRLAQPVWALAFAVITGGVLQLGMQLWQLRRMGLLPRVRSPRRALSDHAVRQVLRLMVPALVGVSVAPISILINTNIASHLARGAVSWLSYADRLMEFPTALLGVALGTVLLPSLSGEFAKGNLERYNRLLDGGLRIVVLLAVPASVGLGLLAEGLSSVLFQGRNFLAEDVLQTSVAMRGYAVGLIGLIALKIIAPAFYARKDIKTPVKVAIAAVAVVQGCNIVTVPMFSHAGLALSVALGACFNAGTLLVILIRRGWYRVLPGWGLFALRSALGAAAMAAFLVWVQTGVDWAAMQSEWLFRIGCVGGVIVGAAVSYFAVMALFGWRGAEILSARRQG